MILYIGLLITFLIGWVIAFFATLAAWLNNKATMRSLRLPFTTWLLGYTLTYAICVTMLFLSPEWDDNGSVSVLEFRDQLRIAFMFTPLLQLIVLPITFAVVYGIRGLFNAIDKKRLAPNG